MSQAHDVLKDTEKRKLYDKYGAEGVERGGGDGGDIFDMFHGGGRRKQ